MFYNHEQRITAPRRHTKRLDPVSAGETHPNRLMALFHLNSHQFVMRKSFQ
jgi:hypothetical protein